MEIYPMFISQSEDDKFPWGRITAISVTIFCERTIRSRPNSSCNRPTWQNFSATICITYSCIGCHILLKVVSCYDSTSLIRAQHGFFNKIFSIFVHALVRHIRDNGRMAIGPWNTCRSSPKRQFSNLCLFLFKLCSMNFIYSSRRPGQNSESLMTHTCTSIKLYTYTSTLAEANHQKIFSSFWL